MKTNFSRNALANCAAGVLVTLAIALALVLRFWIPLSASFLERTELRTLDARFGIRGPLPQDELEKQSEKLAIVAMDDNATRALGYPIAHRSHAKLVEQLKKAGARAIIFDVIFADRAQRDTAGDELFARAIENAGNVFLPFDHDSSQATPPALLSQVETRLSYPLSTRGTARTIRIRPPIPRLFSSERGGGHVASKPDSDGTFRSSILLMEAGKTYPHVILDAIGKSVWKLDLKKNPPQLQDTAQGDYFIWGDHKIGPLSRRVLKRSFYEAGEDGDDGGGAQSTRVGTAWTIPLNFLGGHEAMQVLTVPYLDALQGRADARLKNRVVIIGATATGTPDIRRSPFDKQELFLGVETNATFIANLLDNNFLKDAPFSWAVLACLVLGVVSGVAAFTLRPGISLLVSIGVLALYGIWATSVFSDGNLIVETTAPFLAVVFGYTFLTSLRLFTTDRAAREYSSALRETQTLLGQYVNESLASRLSGDAQMRRDLQIGTRREVSVLFSDIRGFTTWAENQTPEEVKARLDEYFPLMCEIACDDYGGDIDKFIGDGMMAVWNGLSDQSDHASRAVRAALSMKRALSTLNDGWRKQKQGEFKIGIGVASGSAVFGTFGSPRHKLMPTVLGDTVNLASRLEALTKETGAVIIISHETFETIKDEFEVRALGEVEVRGKSQMQPVYEVLGVKLDVKLDVKKPS